MFTEGFINLVPEIPMLFDTGPAAFLERLPPAAAVWSLFGFLFAAEKVVD